jgi:hypothetical protein
MIFFEGLKKETFKPYRLRIENFLFVVMFYHLTVTISFYFGILGSEKGVVYRYI